MTTKKKKPALPVVDKAGPPTAEHPIATPGKRLSMDERAKLQEADYDANPAAYHAAITRPGTPEHAAATQYAAEMRKMYTDLAAKQKPAAKPKPATKPKPAAKPKAAPKAPAGGK